MLRAMGKLTLLCWFLFPHMLFATFHVASTAREVFVDPTNGGMDEPGCLDDAFPCKTLGYAANNTGNNTAIVITSSWLGVDNEVLLVGRHDVSIIGSLNGSVIECTCAYTSSCGLRVEGSFAVELINISIRSCGLKSVLNGTDNDLMSGVFVGNCGNVVFENVTVTRSRGYGVFMMNLYENISVDNCTFSNNAHSNHVGSAGIGGGTGLFILVSVCPFNSTFCHEEHSLSGNYIINNTSFIHNKGNLSINVSIDLWDLHGGGGLTLLLQWGAVKNSFSVTKSHFHNNISPEGGGMYVICHGDCSDNSLLVQECHFHNNTLSKFALGGGGAAIGFKSNNITVFPSGNAFQFKSSNFTNNTGRYTAGLLIFSGSQPHSMTVNNTLEFFSCIWEGNSGSISPAVAVEPSFTSMLDTTFLLTPLFSDCQILRNEISNHIRANTLTFFEYAGVFLISKLTVAFSGRTVFKDNVGTAFYLDSAAAVFQEGSAILFEQNHGFNGGAISLVGYSSVRYGNNTEFHFLENSATIGGAIYVVSFSQHEPISSHTCFLDYVGPQVDSRQLNVTFCFEQNFASSNYAHSMYMSSIQPCRYACHLHTDYLPHPDEVFGNQSCLATFHFDPANVSNNIVTEASEFRATKDEMSLKLIPGRETSMPVQFFDDLSQNVTPITVYTSKLNSNSSLHDDVSIDSAFHFITNNAITLLGCPGSFGDMTLSVQSFRGTSTQLPFELSACPPGYVTSTATDSNRNITSCQCSTSLHSDKWYDGITGCDDTHGVAQISPGYWIGYITNSSSQESEGNLFTAHCPLGFCNYFYQYNNSSKSAFERSYALIPTPSQQELEHLVCAANRQGILCSECKDNQSVFYHSYSFKCGPNTLCHIGPLLYLASELLPITLMFLMILYSEISLTSGMAYSIVFMVQILQPMKISVDGALQFTPQILMDIVNVMYGFLNLDYFSTEQMSFCLWSGAHALDIESVKYFSIIFSLVLITLFVCVQETHLCDCFQTTRFLCRKRLGHSGVRGLSAFFVVCYSQCSKISFSLLNHQPLLGIDGIAYKNKSVVVLDGGLFYLRDTHLYYALPALCCVFLVVVPLPAVLICDIFLVKLESFLFQFSKFRCLQPWTFFRNKLKPFLDSFQGCFRGEHRYFAGLFFLYRLVIYLMSIVTTDMTSYYLFLELFFIVILVLHAVIKPFEVSSHNTVAVLILSCLLLINTLTIHIYTSVSAHGYTSEVTVLQWVQFLFICVPIISSIVVFVWSKIWKALNVRYSGYEEVDVEDIFVDTLDEPRNDDEPDEF